MLGGSLGINELRNNHMFKNKRLSLAEEDIEEAVKNMSSTDLLCAGTPVLTLEGRRSMMISRSGSMGAIQDRDILTINSINSTNASVDGESVAAQDPQKKKSKGLLYSMSPSKLKGKLGKKDKDKEKDKEKDKDKDKSKTKEKGEDGKGMSEPVPRLPDLEVFRLSPTLDSPLQLRHSSLRTSSSPRLRNSLYNISPSYLEMSEDYNSEAQEGGGSGGDRELRRSKNLERLLGPPSVAARIESGSPTFTNGNNNTSGSTPPQSKKLEKLLGDVPTNVFDRNLAQIGNDEEEVSIQEEGVTYNTRKRKGTLPTIKGATLTKLVEKLTHHAESDPSYLAQFLLTYRSFTTPHELLDLLKARFEVNEAGTECEADSTKNKQVVRLRVFNVIKSWLQHHWVDFQDDPDLIDSIMSFTEVLARDMNMAAKQTLVRIITRNKGEEKQKKWTFSQQAPKPHPLVYPPKEKLSLSDVHPEEFARQITLLEFDSYKAIKPWELLSHTQGQKKSPTITAMINRFNDMSKWVQTEILNAGETPKQRAAVFSRLLEICEHLRNLNNFNALMEIISGINASSVFRLKATWALLGSKQLEMFEELNTLMSGNAAYKNLRSALHTVGPPCIPYVGMYLTDLTFINDGNPQFLENGYINFDKCRRLSAAIQEVMQYQQTPYCLVTVDEIQNYLKTLEFEKDDEKLYKLSLQLEERSLASTNGKM